MITVGSVLHAHVKDEDLSLRSYITSVINDHVLIIKPVNGSVWMRETLSFGRCSSFFPMWISISLQKSNLFAHQSHVSFILYIDAFPYNEHCVLFCVLVNRVEDGYVFYVPTMWLSRICFRPQSLVASV